MTINSSPWSIAIEIGNNFTRGTAYIENNYKVVCYGLATNLDNPFKSAVELLSLVTGENTLDISKLRTLSTNIAFEINKNNLICKSGLLITKGLLEKIRQPDMKYLEQIFEIFEIDERIFPEGKIIIPLDEAKIIELIPIIKSKGITSLGICFLNSYSYSTHENIAMEIAKKYLPEINVSLSSKISPKANEYQAISLTASDTMIKNMVKVYLLEFNKQFGSSMKQDKFYFYSSEGFLVNAKSALKNSYNSDGLRITSGIRHCQSLALKTARNTLITMEIGSSYFSFGLLNKGILMSSITKPIPIKLGNLYHYADKSNLELQEIIGYLADSVCELTVQQGYDPRDYTMVAFGAIAHLYVEELAKAIKISRVIIPCQPEYFSVAWLLNATIKDAGRKYLNIPIENDLRNGSEYSEQYNSTISRQLGVKWQGQNKINSLDLPLGFLKQADLSLLKRSFLVDYEIEGTGIPDNIELRLLYIELIRKYKKRDLFKAEEPEYTLIKVSD